MDEDSASRSNWIVAVEAQRRAYIRDVLVIAQKYLELWGRMPTAREVDEHLMGKRALF